MVYRLYFRKSKSKQKKPSEEDIKNEIDEIWFNEKYINKRKLLILLKLQGFLLIWMVHLIKHNVENDDEIIVPNDIL